MNVDLAELHRLGLIRPGKGGIELTEEGQALLELRRKGGTATGTEAVGPTFEGED